MIDRAFNQRMEVPAGKYSAPVTILGLPSISVTTPDTSFVSASLGTFSSTLVTSISNTSMDRINVGALASRNFGPGVVIGPCTWPTEDTTVTDSNHRATVYPQIVCRETKEHTCCPFEATVGTPLSACPPGYMISVANACCPHGWSIFSALLGTQTPCYSQFSTVEPPTATAGADADAGITTIRTALFAKKYDLIPLQTTRPSTSPTSWGLVEPSKRAPSKSRGLNDREIAGVIVGSVLGAMLLFVGITILLLRRLKVRNSTPKITVGDLIRQPTKGTHELAPTDNQYPGMQPRDQSRTTETTQDIPLNTADSISHLPIAYSTDMAPTIRAVEPQELPGNKFINEYHPAYRNDPCSWRN
ncbi:hypothetical protein AJ78_06117 [Emergomyces pasteurianus Ep9510]|uniref:Uncharacterized protein n=1 Tax=Emergomyces pasteurianus Ep9510 TaxID=1447872 RepID=A0A1J9PZU7_9EURO|nr:hypothetical protein AJ78_06117 [Emergomyces pasteurianus Ep9510]